MNARFNGPDLVATWGAANAVLLGVHIGYGGGVSGSIPLALYGGSVLLTELVALAAWWTLRHRPDVATVTPVPRTSRIALWGGVAAAFIVLGLVYDPWLMLPAIYPLVGVLIELVSSSSPRRDGRYWWRARSASSSGSGAVRG
jgi:hypothetical protein